MIKTAKVQSIDTAVAAAADDVGGGGDGGGGGGALSAIRLCPGRYTVTSTSGGLFLSDI